MNHQLRYKPDDELETVQGIQFFSLKICPCYHNLQHMYTAVFLFFECDHPIDC